MGMDADNPLMPTLNEILECGDELAEIVAEAVCRLDALLSVVELRRELDKWGEGK